MPDENVWQLIHPKLREVLQSLEYCSFTSIQRIAIPKILATDYHVIISAPTGSGKTEAALIPTLSNILYNQGSYEPISVLYTTPLRALNRDLYHRIERLTKALSLEVAIWYGDTPQRMRKYKNQTSRHINNNT